jgi:hypothetical protein
LRIGLADYAEFVHVVGVDLEGLHGGHVEAFLLDEAVLDVSGFGGLDEDGGVVDAALAELGWEGWVGVGLEVLDVKHGDARGVVFEVVDGVGATDDDPAAVHFKGDFGGIGEAEKLVVGDDAVDLVEFHGVVVIAEAHACGDDFFRDLVELVGVPAPIVEGVGVIAVRVLRGGGVFESRAGADDVTDTDLFVEGDDLVEFFVEIVGGVVSADEMKARGGHGLFDFGRGVIEVAGRFYFAIAEGSDFFQGAIVVFGKECAHGVELQAEWDAEDARPGEEAAALGEGGAEESGGTGLEKDSSRRIQRGPLSGSELLDLSAKNDRRPLEFCRPHSWRRSVGGRCGLWRGCWLR